MDTYLTMTYIGHKLTNNQLKELLSNKKHKKYFGKDSFYEVESSASTPIGEVAKVEEVTIRPCLNRSILDKSASAKKGSYKGCLVVEMFNFGNGVCLFGVPWDENSESEEVEYRIGYVISATASRWSDGDGGCFANQQIPNIDKIKKTVRKLGFSPEKSYKIEQVYGLETTIS